MFSAISANNLEAVRLLADVRQAFGQATFILTSLFAENS